MAPCEKGIHNNLGLVHNQMNKRKHFFVENTFKILGKIYMNSMEE
jgi:hypothetical protein